MLKKLGITTVFCLLIFSIVSCTSDNVENIEKNEVTTSISQETFVPKETELKELVLDESAKYIVFMEMLSSNLYEIEELEDYLNEWSLVDANSPDLAFAKSLLLMTTAYTICDNSEELFLNEVPYNLLKNKETGNYELHYESFNLDLPNFEAATKILKDTAKIYPNRIDFWATLLKIYTTHVMYEKARDTALDYINAIKKVKDNNVSWYLTNNQKLEFENKEDEDLYLINVIRTYTQQWLNAYTTSDSKNYAYEVSKKLLEVFPDNIIIYNEIGLSLMDKNPEEACVYFQKAHEKEPYDLIYVFNLGISALLSEDFELYNDCASSINNSKDQELIDSFYQTINMIKSSLIDK